ncbi:LysR family transcriptional regulator [Hoeflea sp.]|uniref:LysR family transcriptional regulator n=1 Tax=Hoeflea sp. TaxID=1940281 RepID=UPI0025C16349|nr:LysR family transcriptional regulator [Hoeflea sp.]
MRFKGLDLNLLVVLDALLTTRNVSRAGEVLNLSQSATSGALARLRDYFGDTLLVQQGRGMVPTPLGAALAPQIRNALTQIEGTIIARPGFEPAIADREIRIIASDYVMVVWLAPVISAIAMEAPGLRFRIDPPTVDPEGQLDSGSADLLLMPGKYLAEQHPSAHCFDDEYCVIACERNPEIGSSISVEEFYAASHVDAAFPTVVPGYTDWFTRQSGQERQVGVLAGGFAALPYFVLGSRRIALVHKRLARIYAEHLPIRMLPAPFDIPKIEERLQWHRFADEDECLRWVRERILGHDAIDGIDNTDP